LSRAKTTTPNCFEKMIEAELCVFCQIKGAPTNAHHIVPKCKGGKDTVPACKTCETFIHSRWSHNELRDTFNNVETILDNEDFQKFLKWRCKQPATAFFKSERHQTRSRNPYK